MWKDMEINTATTIEGLIKGLESLNQDTVKVAKKIVEDVSREGLVDNYSSVRQLPIQNNGNSISGGIETTEEKEIYQEYGTGIVGSTNPHPEASMAGWIYDVNEHGEEGWKYQDKVGNWHWTKGQVAKKKFYNAGKRMEKTLEREINKEF